MPQQQGTPKNNHRIIVAQGEGGQSQHGSEASEAVVGATDTHAATSHGDGHSANPLAHHKPAYFSSVGLGVAVLLLIFVLICRAGGLHKQLRSKGQALLEQGVESMNVFCQRAIGPGGEKFMPLVATVFSFVLVSNLMGVLPTVLQKSGEGVAHLIPSPTANLSMTAAIALVVFVVVQAAGIKANGVGGHLKHFAGPIPALSPLLFPLEIIGALAKPVSLSIRLFGNVFGEETVIAVLVSLAVTTLPAFLPIPFQFPMLMFGVFGSLVQAGVFTILTCAYISLSLGEHSEHAQHHDEHHPEQLLGREAVTPG